jgi:hypothetical protein
MAWQGIGWDHSIVWTTLNNTCSREFLQKVKDLSEGGWLRYNPCTETEAELKE